MEKAETTRMDGRCGVAGASAKRTGDASILVVAALSFGLFGLQVGCDRTPSASNSEEKRAESKSKTEASSESTDEKPADEKPADEEREAVEREGGKSSDAESPSVADRSDGGAEGKTPGELPDGTDRQRRLLAEAKSAFLKNDLEEAEPLFEKVVEKGPMSGARASAYIALGQIYVQTDRADRAIELLESVPEPGPKVVELRLVSARAYKKAGRIEEAIGEYESVVELQPNYIFVYPTLGGLYAEQGEEKKAAEIYLDYENRLESMARAVENPEDSTPVDRVNALDFFSAIDDERAEEAVENALEDPVPDVRAKAAQTAAAMRIGSAKSKLEEMVEADESEGVRTAASAALETLKRSD